MNSKENRDYPFGVNFVGYVTGEFGGGEGARSIIRAMEAVDIPLEINNINVNWHRNLDPSYIHFSEKKPYAINLIHINPVAEELSKISDEYFQNRYNIGFWVWELPEFNRKWDFALELFDEIWTYSNFSAEAIASVAPIPVIKIMPSLELPKNILLKREDLDLPKDKFIFLFIFDFHSSIERKNPLAIIEAFTQAFEKTNEDVLLVLKFSNAQYYPEKRDMLLEKAASHPSIRLIEGHLSRREIQALIYHCNCYVSLHRAEGFGLTMAEAMFYEKPVIATAYSSNTDFMNVGNSFPVRYQLVEYQEEYQAYPVGSIWADPDIAHAASLMQYVFDNYVEAQQIGARAAREIRHLLSAKVVGHKIRNRLELLMSRIAHSQGLNTLPNIEAEKNYWEAQSLAWKQTALELQRELDGRRPPQKELKVLA